MRVLFDKKVFLSLLHELENMRKILQVKKMYYIFHLPYEGKPQRMNDWHWKVAHRTTQTLKFMQSARLLRIIGYDPTQYISLHKLSSVSKNTISGPTRSSQMAIQNYELQNLGASVVNRYSYAGSFLRSIVSVVSELNVWGLPKQTFYKKMISSVAAAKYGELTPEQKGTTFEKQQRMNASKPTPSGVISSPDPDRQTAI